MVEEKKIKLTKLETATQFIENGQEAKCHAEKLRIEVLAKAKARIEIFHKYKTEGQEVIPVSDTAAIGETIFLSNKLSNYRNLN